MPYVSGFDRNQLMCCSWDEFVDEESIARIIDVFVEHLAFISFILMSYFKP